MKKLLILGAGLSSSSLIRYVINLTAELDLHVTIVDSQLDLIRKKTKDHPKTTAFAIDALNAEQRRPLIAESDLVISMLPARFHPEIARDCLDLGVHLLTPSYISKEMKAMDAEAREKGVLIMNEMGVDPGIDHMSAMKIIDEIKEKGGVLHSFKSFCGGLVAPESDNNPLNYKFTWNPRNVVLAGQGGASCFIEENQHKYIPYHRLFNRLDHMEISGFGSFEGYANRDSLKYRSIYGLDEIPTIYRGTLRRPGYSAFWSTLIDLGLTDDAYSMEKSEKLSPRALLNAFLPYHPTETVENKLRAFVKSDELYNKFEWLGFFEENNFMGVENASPAQLLQVILERKLSLERGDKDMLVMYHEFTYHQNGKKHEVVSSMVNIGEDEVYTSMSNTVGLPLAICAKMILKDEIQLTGVQMPLDKAIYEPILNELDSLGIRFEESERELN